MTKPYRRRRGRLTYLAATAMVALALGGCTRGRLHRPARVPTTAPATAAPAPVAPIASSGLPGVVNIDVRLPGARAAGTGMVLTSGGEILTNNHVIEGGLTITVTVAGTDQAFAAQVVGTDPANDVAVLRTTRQANLTPIVIGDSDTVRVGDAVTAVGNAGGQGGAPSLAPGRVVALHRQITATDANGANRETLPDTIQVDADVLPGYSGGPLVDDGHRVVGITTAASANRSRYRTGERQGFAIPINRVLAIAGRFER
jgi:S1-C subfamily serine protease